MICLRCGYCCIHLEVIIVDDPSKGIQEDNLIPKHTGERCKHLLPNGNCAVHNEPWYEETPCFAYTQIERGNQLCRRGVFIKKIEGVKK